MKKEKLVIALGGNALGTTPTEQKTIVQSTAKVIVDLAEDGFDLVLTHGNGPQVGMIHNAMQYAYEHNGGTPEMPLCECGALSEGYIGYHLQQAIQNELTIRNSDTQCITLVSQVEVDANDSAFQNPTKPIGSFYTQQQAEQIAKEKGYVMKEDAGRGYRRVVASPLPKRIVEEKSIATLLEQGTIVICCGGGGVPVVYQDGTYQGVDAVIDKDETSSLLATTVHADKLCILTAIDGAYLNYRTEEEEKLDVITLADVDRYIEEGQFAAGSMLPKILACKKFVQATGNEAIIGSLENAKDALKGTSGTRIVK